MNTLDKIYNLSVDIRNIEGKYNSYAKFFDDDRKTSIIRVRLLNNGTPINLEGCIVEAYFVLANNSYHSESCKIVNSSEGEIELELCQECLVIGENIVRISISKGDEIANTPIITYSVKKGLYSDDNPNFNDDPLTPMLNQMLLDVKVTQVNQIELQERYEKAFPQIQSKINEVDERLKKIDEAIASGTQDLEVKEARDGETSLKARLDRDLAKGKEIYSEVEGSYMTTDSNEGYLENIEILGNTIQDIENLADIRSVGDKVEGQELYEIPVLSCGKNFNSGLELGGLNTTTGDISVDNTKFRSKHYIKIKPNMDINIKMYTQDLVVNSIFEYDANLKFIKNISPGTALSSNCAYIKVQGRHTTNGTDITSILNNNVDLQIEEGTVATPYEPYQEDKLTILSPVQLEKVGDVADRLICKNGVWGVEKNIETVVFDGTVVHGDVSSSFPSDNSSMFLIRYADVARDSVLICNKFSNKDISSSYNRNVEGVFVSVNGDATAFYFRIFNDKLSTQDVAGFKQWLSENNVTIKYKTINPTFIPLPHSQQVKLRTFANKTNISFLTEIEGTIKTQVPKSLGATVNTHTEQINNLNKELDRVKKLEESTVSTVETESDFTTVEATSNGYFEDVKLEGKTLVNKMPNNTGEKQFITIDFKTLYQLANVQYTNLEIGKEYTVISDIDTSKFKMAVYKNGGTSHIVSYQATNAIKFTVPSDATVDIRVYIQGQIENIGLTTIRFIMLEGDHTQNPPSYFEGLKSVGDGADEIVVLSTDNYIKPLNESDIPVKVASQTKYEIHEGRRTYCATENVMVNLDFESNTYDSGYIYCDLIGDNNNFSVDVKVQGSKTMYVFYWDANKQVINGNGARPISLVGDGTWQTVQCNLPKGAKYYGIRIAYTSSNTTKAYIDIDSIKISNENLNYPKTDKKRLLFYNEETQTWGKPILREWDSIEKHSNGKYYYHQRSGEVVLNGSENWRLNSDPNSIECIPFEYVVNDKYNNPNTKALNLVNDKFSVKDADTVYAQDVEGIVDRLNLIRIKIQRSKLSTQDVQGFKQWLQANNVTVVYQLAEEKVYECTNIDLITYANETNYIVESGAIAPKSILKVHNNISNVVSLLQKKVSLLESNITNYMITQNRMQLASTYSADSVTFKVDYALCSEEVEYNEDLYNLILNNILVGKDNYDYDKMFTMILDYASWNQISWEQFDILVGLMDIQHNPPVEDEVIEEIPNEIM